MSAIEVWKAKVSVALGLYTHEDATRWRKFNAQAALNGLFFAAITIKALSVPKNVDLTNFYSLLFWGSVVAVVLNGLYNIAMYRSVQYLREQWAKLKAIEDLLPGGSNEYEATVCAEPDPFLGFLTSNMVMMIISCLCTALWIVVALCILILP